MTLGGTMRPGRAQRIPFQTGGAWPALRRSMMRFLSLAFVAASLICGRALAIQLSDLAGTWLHASVEVDGNAITDGNLLEAEMEISGDKYTFRMGDNTAKGTVKLDASVTPARIDITEVEGRNQGRTLVGLANTTADGWKLALNIQGGDRPAALSSEGGIALISYKRKPGTTRPLRGLLITGGCCHDYPGQAKILTEGLSARVNIGWDVVMDPGQTGTKHKVSVYKAEDWAAKYDVVLHNECFADEKELDWLERIVRPHREGVPAVVIHCAMHCYRAPTNDWFRFVGVTSHGHGSHFAYAMTNVAPAHPVMKGFPATWQTPKEELYNIAAVERTATPLATGWSHETKKAEVNVWVNQFGKGRVFGTTIGHYNHTLQDPAVLDLLARGLLWSTGKLTDDGKAAAGFGR